jgi:hypothetical protein
LSGVRLILDAERVGGTGLADGTASAFGAKA